MNDQEKRKDVRLRAKHRITLWRFYEMGEAQEWCCAICQMKMEPISDRAGIADAACVDHCHDTGKIRALLCGRCNIGLGYFRDDPEIMLAAAKYLETHSYGREYVGLNS